MERVRTMNPQLRLFLIGTILLGTAGSIAETPFNNFLAEKHRLGADERGFLEFPREVHGFLTVLFACLVTDQLLFGTGMARDIYLSKIAMRPEDVAPSLSMGVTINHIVSMSIPSLGGIMWMKLGHQSVFIAAAAVALLMLLVTRMIKIPTHADPLTNG